MFERLEREYRRLIKEARPCCAVWLFGLLGLWLIEKVYSILTDEMSDPEPYFLLIPFISCLIIGVIPFGHEFRHGTMEYLLVRPIRRSRLWYEKMFVLGVLNGSIILFHYFYFGGFIYSKAYLRKIILNYAGLLGAPWLYSWISFDPDATAVYHFFAFFRSPCPFIFLASFILGPLLSLYLRQSDKAFWPQLIFIPFIGLFLVWLETIIHHYNNALLYYYFEYFRIMYIVLTIWGGYWLARRRFMKLEL
ncbi:hypothetical protein JXQ70_12240 [bacterium]|nr:hypothetical protein [bacterium]